MSLATGNYTIRSAAFSHPYIARNPVEDFSFNPKAIVTLPGIVTDPEFLEWAIENVGNDQYILRSRGAPTVPINGLIYGILLDYPSPQKWSLENLPLYGADQYMITSNGTMGWVSPGEEDFTQVEFKELIATSSLPPQYPAIQRWIIESLDDLD